MEMSLELSRVFSPSNIFCTNLKGASTSRRILFCDHVQVGFLQMQQRVTPDCRLDHQDPLHESERATPEMGLSS
jgi:hypothetical protein